MTKLVAVFVAGALLVAPAVQVVSSSAVILVTLDGARTEEVFGGLDLAVLRSTLAKDAKVEDQPIYKRFWADTPEARREKLMPFFWRTLMREHGSVAGNPALGSRVQTTNRLWFSYPGYAELLLGVAHDDVIKSNDPVRNPYPTVLEFLKDRLRLTKEQVAVFGSWAVFNAIAEHTEGAITINAGSEAFDSPAPPIAAMSQLQFETPTPWDSARQDAYTFRFAMDHLARYQPRVMYLALDETDDWAHDGRYDRLLEAYTRSDGYLRELWTWLQSQPLYRGRTSLIVTTDHGRGHTIEDWRNHGEKYPGAGDTWMALVSPAMTRRGEWSRHAPLTNAQVASTLVTWMGLDWKAFNPAAAPPVQ